MSTMKYHRKPLDWEKEEQYLMPWKESDYDTRIVGQDSRLSRIKKNSVRGKALVQNIKRNCLNEIIIMVVQMTTDYSWAVFCNRKIHKSAAILYRGTCNLNLLFS